MEAAQIALAIGAAAVGIVAVIKNNGDGLVLAFLFLIGSCVIHNP